MDSKDKYMKKVACNWRYVRRVPKRYQGVDPRTYSTLSMKTRSVATARAIRDRLLEADDLYWASLLLSRFGEQGTGDHILIEARYKKQCVLAIEGVRMRTSGALRARAGNIEALTSRLEIMADRHWRKEKASTQQDERQLVEDLKVKAAFRRYLEEMSFDATHPKSPTQQQIWRRAKTASMKYFVKVCGNKRLGQITREDALKYRNWWRKRITNGTSPNTANRHIGSIRDLYTQCFEHYGIRDQINPFAKLHFADPRKCKRPRFSDEWIAENLIVPDVLSGARLEFVLVMYALLETGCRLGEICNLETEDIVLDVSTPHILIRPKRKRCIKSKQSIREIPLVGLALEAMRRAPNGFPAYRDRGNILGPALLRTMRKRNLCPTPEHVLHCFRHSFEDRMLEAGIDSDLRRRLMGHKSLRAEYGEGGSMSFKTTQMNKMAFSFAPEVVASLPRLS